MNMKHNIEQPPVAERKIDDRPIVTALKIFQFMVMAWIVELLFAIVYWMSSGTYVYNEDLGNVMVRTPMAQSVMTYSIVIFAAICLILFVLAFIAQETRKD